MAGKRGDIRHYAVASEEGNVGYVHLPRKITKHTDDKVRPRVLQKAMVPPQMHEDQASLHS